VPISKFIYRAARSLRWHLNDLFERYLLPWPRILVLHFNNRLGHRRLIDQGNIDEGNTAVVSVTTRKDRVAKIYLVFESIAQGIVRPSRAILWIDDPTVFAALPPSLVRLQKRGLEVRLCENFGPHTKYFPYVCSIKHHEESLVTGDDDQLYPRNWLQCLIAAKRHAPDNVHCHFAKVVGLVENGFVPYEKWPVCNSTAARFDHIALGVSGVIYPPRLLDILREAGTGFRECCPRADDVWLHAQAIRAGYRVQQLKAVPHIFLQIPGSQKIALWRQNISEGGNNGQIRATYSPSDCAIIVGEGGGCESLAGSANHVNGL